MKRLLGFVLLASSSFLLLAESAPMLRMPGSPSAASNPYPCSEQIEAM